VKGGSWLVWGCWGVCGGGAGGLVICFKNLSQSTLFYLSRSPSSMKAINCHSLLPKTTLKC
jgi:hypothetical protein